MILFVICHPPPTTEFSGGRFKSIRRSSSLPLNDLSSSFLRRPPLKVRRLPHRRARGLPPLRRRRHFAGVGHGGAAGLPGGGDGDAAEVPPDVLRQRADVPRADRHPSPLGNVQPPPSFCLCARGVREENILCDPTVEIRKDTEHPWQQSYYDVPPRVLFPMLRISMDPPDSHQRVNSSHLSSVKTF